MPQVLERYTEWPHPKDILDGSFAPEGRYRVYVDDTVLPGINQGPAQEIEFLASDMPCVTRQAWQGATAAKTNEPYGAHILDGHVLSPKTKGGKSPKDRFGNYDSSLSINRPMVFDPLPGKPVEYNEKWANRVDAPAGWTVTKNLISAPPFDRVMRIAAAVRSRGITDPLNHFFDMRGTDQRSPRLSDVNT